MRMRKKKNTPKRLEQCAEYIVHTKNDIGKKPIALEIGCGKGDFITGLAARETQNNFVAVEKISDVLVIAAEKAKKAELHNVKFLISDAVALTEYFEAGDVSRIYLNFSDPWPKAGHYKRRLTYSSFLSLYKSILGEHGEIFLKTDNSVLFDFSLQQFEENGFSLRELTRDLHNSEYNDGNIQTEYERNFSEQGIPINRVVAYY